MYALRLLLVLSFFMASPAFAQNISLKDINSMASKCEDGFTFYFRNGSYHHEKKISDSTGDQGLVEIVHADIVNAAFGDLTGNGEQNAAVVYYFNTGGTGFLYVLTVVEKVDGNLKELACAGLGDRTQINAISIKDGVISLDVTTHGPNDGACCPTVRKTWTYVLQNGELVKQ